MQTHMCEPHTTTLIDTHIPKLNISAETRIHRAQNACNLDVTIKYFLQLLIISIFIYLA